MAAEDSSVLVCYDSASWVITRDGKPVPKDEQEVGDVYAMTWGHNITTHTKKASEADRYTRAEAIERVREAQWRNPRLIPVEEATDIP